MPPAERSLDQPEQLPAVPLQGEALPPIPQSGGSGFSPFAWNGMAAKITAVTIASIAIIGGTALGVAFFGHKGDGSGTGNGNNYAVSTIDVSQIKNDSLLRSGQAESLQVNGQLKVSQAFVLTPAEEPTSPAQGQIYYDSNTNQPYYYNGSQFVGLGQVTGQTVTSIGGAAGVIALGNGLTISGNTLSVSSSIIQAAANSDSTGASGPRVSSLQGLTGDITLTAGSGIAISGTTITNTGVTNLTSSDSSVIIANQGNGHYDLSVSASGSGGSVLIGPNAAQTDSSNNPTERINKTGSGNFLEFASNGVNKFVVDQSGTITSGLISYSQVQGAPATTVTSIGGAVGAVSLGAGLGRTGSTLTNTGVISLTGTASQITVSAASGDITLSLPQNIATSSSPTFAGLTLGAMNGVLKASAGTVSAGTVALGTDTTGVYVASLGSLTGLTTTGNGVASSTPTLAVTYGSGANTAVQGNTQFTCTGVTGANLSGGGATITEGTGGACGNISLSNSPTFSGNLAVQGAGGLTLGSATNTGQLVFLDGTSDGFSGSLKLSGPILANQSYALPTTGGTICVFEAANCSGSSGISTTGTPTTNTIALFSGSSSIANSILSQVGSTDIIDNGNLKVQGVGGLVLGSGSNTVSLVAGASGTPLAFTLPTADGGAGNCLVTDSAGHLSFAACLNGSSGGSGGVASLNGESGSVSIQGTTNQVTVTPSGQNITLSLPQSINTTAAVTFGSLGLSTALTITNGGTGATTAAGALANLGAAASGVNGDITALNGLTTALPITEGGTGATTASGARANLGAAASGSNSDITALTGLTTAVAANEGGTGQSSYTIGDLLYANTASTLGKLSDVAVGACLISGGVGVAPSWGSCTGGAGGGVTSLDGQVGVLTLNNSSSPSAGVIQIDKAHANGSTLGLATFNSTDFTDNGSGVISLNTTGVTAASYGSASSVATFTVNSKGQLSVAGSTTIAINGNQITSGTVGDTYLSGNVALYNNVTSNFTGTSLQHNGNDICDTTGNCVATGAPGAAIGGGGTAGKIALFTGAGYAIGDSALTQASGNLSATGGLTLQGASGLTLGTTSTAGLITINDGSAHTITLSSAVQGNNVALTIPATTTTDTLCLQTLGNCSGAGVTTVGALDGGTPNSAGATISTNTIYLQSATNLLPGLVNITTQTFAGNKTFTGTLTVTNTGNSSIAGNLGIGTASPITQLHIAGSLPAGPLSNIAASQPRVFLVGRYLYVTGYTSSATLKIYDVSNPASMTLVSSVATGSNPTNPVIQGKYAYVANNGAHTVQVIDVSNANAPSVVSTTSVGSTFPQWIAVSGKYAYVVDCCTNAALYVLDISNPATPSVVGTLTIGGAPRELVVQGKYVYIADSTNLLKVVDVSNPASPTLTSSTATGASTSPFAITVSGHYAYMPESGTGVFQVWDIKNPASPSNVGTVLLGNSTSTPYNVAIEDRTAYVAAYNTDVIYAVDISNPASPSVTGSIPGGTGNNPFSIALSGRYAFVGNQNGALTSFDLGGAYIQGFEAGSIETSAFQAKDNATVGQDLSVGGGLSIGGASTFNGGAGVVGQLKASAGASGTVAAIIQGASGQTADLLDLQNSSGTNLVAFTSAGNLTFGQASTIGAASVSSGTANGITIQAGNNTGSGLAGGNVTIDAGTDTVGAGTNGTVNIGTTSASALTFGNITKTSTVTFKSNGASTNAFAVQNASGANILAADSVNRRVAIGGPEISFVNPNWGGGSFSMGSQAPYTVSTQAWGVASADFNGDGYNDIVATSENSANVYVLMNNGNGTFGTAVAYSTRALGNPTNVVAADFNGDGWPDIAISDIGWNTVTVLMNNGNGTFASYVQYNGTNQLRSLAVADVNGDGHPDIVAAGNVSSSINVFINNGNGTFAGAVNYSTGASTGPVDLVLADFNNDGHPDVATSDQSNNNVSILLNAGNGTFGTATTFSTGAGTAPQGIAAADLNGDGNQDLIVGNYSTSNISVYLGSGTGTFGSATNYSTGSSPYRIRTADMNGDGHPDVIVDSQGASTVTVFINNGTGTLTANNFGVGSGPIGLAVADVNNDGIKDIITGNAGTTTISVILNTSGSGAQFKPTLSVTSTAPGEGGIYIQGASSQTANLFVIQDASGNSYLSEDASGNLAVSGTIKLTNSISGSVAMTLKGASGQTADLMDLQNNSGQALVSFDKNGQLTLGNPSAGSQAGKLSFADGTNDGFLVSIATAAQGNNVALSIPADTNTTDTICLQTKANCSGTATTLQGAYTASTGGSTSEIVEDATRQGLDIQAYSGQVADLLDLRDSSANVLASVNASGQLVSSLTTGTAPFVVASTTKVTNLNADLLDGLDSTAFGDATAANQTTILSRIGTNADAAGTSTLFARLAEIDNTDLGATADAASNTGTIFARLTDLYNRIVTLNSSVGATSDSANSSGSVNAKLAYIIANMGGIGKQQYQQVFTASGTWTQPGGVTQVQLLVVGGGGGGGGGCGASVSKEWGGGGGGGGAVVQSTLTVAANQTVTIGAGGTAGSGASGTSNSCTGPAATSGGQGGTTSFGSVQAGGGGGGGAAGLTGGSGTINGSGGGAGALITTQLQGGAGDGTGSDGQQNSQCSSSINSGGAGGGAGSAPTLGVIIYVGTSSNNICHASNGGAGLYGYGGGGGSGAVNFTPSTGWFGGVGANGGGSGTLSSAAGGSGRANTGGGGAGGTANGSTGTNGGAGGSGIVIVTWWQ